MLNHPLAEPPSSSGSQSPDRRPWALARAGEWPAVAVIVGVFAAGWLFVGPRANVPVIDDWVYAWSVEHLLDTGRLQVLEFSAIYPIAQVLWGALFARAAGLSFGVLRLSTVVLSVVACVAVYATLREMGCRRSTGLLGALALAVDPVYFALSFSFMTEVPFVSASTLALYWYVRAARRDEVWPLWAGGLCSVLAFLVRPIGIALPASMLPALLWRSDWRASIKRSALPIVTALAAMGVLQVGIPRMLGTLDWAGVRQGYLRWWFTIPMTDYLTWNINVLFVSVFPLVPLLLPFITRWRRVWPASAAALALAVICRVALGGLSTPLPDWQTWSLQDIAARAMVGGPLGPSAWSIRAAPAVRLIGLLAMASLVAIFVRRRAGSSRWGRPELVVLTMAGLHVAMIHALWFYNDRYYVVLAPLVAIIAAQAIDTDGRAKWLAVPLLGVWAVVSATGTRDMLAYNDACARAAQELEAAGIPPVEVDAGYPLNGWRLYAHPENLPPGSDRRYDVPFVTSDRSTRYSIANGPTSDSDVVRVIPLERASWQASRVLYVVRRR